MDRLAPRFPPFFHIWTVRYINEACLTLNAKISSHHISMIDAEREIDMHTCTQPCSRDSLSHTKTHIHTHTTRHILHVNLSIGIFGLISNRHECCFRGVLMLNAPVPCLPFEIAIANLTADSIIKWVFSQHLFYIHYGSLKF